MELGIYMNKTSFLSMLPHVVSLGLPTAPSAHWKARSSSKSGYIYETRLNKFRLDLATIGKNIRYSGSSTRGFKTSILPSYFSAKSFFFGIVSQRVGAHCYTGTMGWHNFLGKYLLSKLFTALRHIYWKMDVWKLPRWWHTVCPTDIGPTSRPNISS